MKTSGVTPWLGLVTGLALLLAALPLARADAARDHDHDHDRARAALQAGEVLPLATIQEKVQRSHPGDTLKVELERKDGRWVYEFKLLQADGALLRLDVDARTGDVLKTRQRALPAANRDAARVDVAR
ncbi:MAG: PepSY domain-containing protein [Burkholderiales bacterium]|nr:PepSY domain-containing protein [Burkholderiales bacterium]